MADDLERFLHRPRRFKLASLSAAALLAVSIGIGWWAFGPGASGPPTPVINGDPVSAVALEVKVYRQGRLSPLSHALPLETDVDHVQFLVFHF